MKRLFAVLALASVPSSAWSAVPEPVALEEAHSLAIDPVVSPDGRWLAFASDGGAPGKLRLWIRPLAGGPARQLTQDAGQPAFSPDGNTLAYRGESNGGGVYLIPVDGGAPRLLAAGGHRPRFSPDGRRIAYHTAAGLFVVNAAGGAPNLVHAAGSNAAWSPNGRHLILSVCSGTDAACDWWVSSPEGGVPVPVGAAKLFKSLHFSSHPVPDLWLASGNAILFTAKSGEQTRLWTLNIRPESHQAQGPPRRLTISETDERSASATRDGRILFASRRENVDVYTMPLAADRAAPKGPLVRLTTDPSVDQRPTISRDGGKIAWETSRGGNFEVWVKDLSSGRERGITNGPLREHMPAISRDGARVLYDAHDGEKVTIFATGFDGGDPVNIAEENVGQGSFQWSADNNALLYFHRAPPGTVGLLDLATKKRTPLLRHPKFNLSLADARLSPDERWIAFPVPFAPHRSRLAVARLTGKVIEDERDWTWLTPETENAFQPEWSPNGRWLYFLSDQTGKLAVYAIPLSSVKTARSAPRPVLDFPNARISIADMRPRDIGLAVGKSKMALAATRYDATLWSIRP